MRTFNSATAFMIGLLLVIVILAISAFSFFGGMERSFILIQKGTTPVRHVLNHHAYIQNKRGFIFALTFLVSALSFFIMIMLPDDESAPAAKISKTPEPVRRTGREESGISAVVESAPVEELQEEPGPVRIIEKPDEELPAPSAAAEPIIETAETDDTLLDAESLDDVKEGEDDVVYGSGPISDAAIIHFVHKFPDSALKFLYRKQLDGKALSNTEEEIYQHWEKRQMTRGKVKSYIKTLMDWKDLPKKPLYEIWKELRDHIFENVELN